MFGCAGQMEPENISEHAGSGGGGDSRMTTFLAGETESAAGGEEGAAGSGEGRPEGGDGG